MSNEAKMLVFVNCQMACIKIAGRANFTSSLDFKTVVEELTQRSIQRLVLDLTNCVLMDSTFLGVLSGFGLKAYSANNGQSNGSNGSPHVPNIELMNPNPRISDLLENLGVLHLFKVVHGSCDELSKIATAPVAVPSGDASREQITRNCLEAHKTLMEVTPANVPKFKEVTEFLAQDLRKMKSE